MHSCKIFSFIKKDGLEVQFCLGIVPTKLLLQDLKTWSFYIHTDIKILNLE